MAENGENVEVWFSTSRLCAAKCSSNTSLSRENVYRQHPLLRSFLLPSIRRLQELFSFQHSLLNCVWESFQAIPSDSTLCSGASCCLRSVNSRSCLASNICHYLQPSTHSKLLRASCPSTYF